MHFTVSTGSTERLEPIQGSYLTGFKKPKAKPKVLKSIKIPLDRFLNDLRNSLFRNIAMMG